jgi:hypothetical protein
MFNPTATSCPITYKAVNKTNAFNAFAFVGGDSNAVVTSVESSVAEEAGVDPVGSPVSAAESGVSEMDLQGESSDGQGDAGEYSQFTCRLLQLNNVQCFPFSF